MCVIRRVRVCDPLRVCVSQADYNLLKRIDSGVLRFLFKLRVLILNDNLISALPAHLFR